MREFFTIFAAVIVPLVILDAIWLWLTGRWFYKKHIGHLMAARTTWWPVILFYVVYAFALTAFVVAPALERGDSSMPTFVMGALLGLAAYGTYDFTNHATLKHWPSAVTAVDLVWGMLMTGTTAAVAASLIRLMA